MNNDTLERIGGSVIQHGKMNDRIYLMKLNKDDVPDIIPKLNALAEESGYSKIFAKVPETLRDTFLGDGYKEEANIPRFYKGEVDYSFLGKYLSDDRKALSNEDEIKDVLNAAKGRSSSAEPTVNKDIFVLRKAGPADIPAMCRIYKEVFKSYPFPIHDPQYLLDTMKADVDYFVASRGEEVAAVSSSEKDPEAQNSEMTDFATLPEFRGKGLSGRLLRFMEISAAEEGIKTAYTIARAISYGMNISFAKGGYVFAGTLVNNTNISGSIESMNVWYKHLDNSG